jgi:hypothetical protein
MSQIGEGVMNNSITQATNQPTRTSKVAENVQKQSQWILVTFTTFKYTCPPVYINDVQLAQEEDVKYLGLHFDRRLT